MFHDHGIMILPTNGVSIDVQQLTRLLESVMKFAVLIQHNRVRQTKAQYNHHQSLNICFRTLLGNRFRNGKRAHAARSDQKALPPAKLISAPTQYPSTCRTVIEASIGKFQTKS